MNDQNFSVYVQKGTKSDGTFVVDLLEKSTKSSYLLVEDGVAGAHG
jgi:hypothetical protein